MIPTRYEPERSNVAMVAHPEGRFILYADAEKWVEEAVARATLSYAWEAAMGRTKINTLNEEIAAFDIITISRLKGDLCDMRINLEAALTLCKQRSEEITKKDGEIAQACVIIAGGLKVVEELEGQIAALKAEPKEQFEQSISIIHDQGAENILLKEEIAKKEEMIFGLRENKLYLENDLALKMEEIAGPKEKIKELEAENERLLIFVKSVATEGQHDLGSNKLCDCVLCRIIRSATKTKEGI